MEPDSLQSYVRFMKEQLFDHVDIPKENYFIPDGTVPASKVKDFSEEKAVKMLLSGNKKSRFLAGFFYC